ncbi:ribokinase [Jiulongibacter sediminis]|uniref:Ribokinase n=1 Tax=Jiulongibacter sediminis TaxID=1605367 RepID=A0A0P7C497_9BACT|nr:ribokinase [Jiulongibacter sediminis]KPM46703.1 ribokinase [Jiulongibacter sediminis]TBX21608.1 ribokinase [Jiulongibacter sediminis]
MNLFVIGSSNMDLVIKLPKIPSPGETLLGSDSAMVFGGKGANQAVATKRAGGQIGFITKLGNDLYGDQMRSHLIKEGLPEEYLLKDKNRPSGTAQIWVSEAGENAIAVSPGSNAALVPEDLMPFAEQLKTADFILMQLEIPLETVEYVIELTKDSSAKVILNPAPAQELSDDLLSKLWMITPNEHEAVYLTNGKVENIEDMAVTLFQKGVRNVLMTLGERGSLLYNKKGKTYFKTPKVKPRDSTAAGDVFNGYLAALLSQNKPLNEAIEIATKAAAHSVTIEGAQPSIPYLRDIEHN